MPILRSQSAHPLDPLSPTEIAVAIATVRAAGETPEVSVKHLSILFDSRVIHFVILRMWVIVYF